MSDKEILYKAILKAEKNGYTDHYAHVPIEDTREASEIFYDHKRVIIFSHSFAKAFFGETDIIYCCEAWVKRLEEMSKEENEIKYLEKFL